MILFQIDAESHSTEIFHKVPLGKLHGPNSKHAEYANFVTWPNDFLNGKLHVLWSDRLSCWRHFKSATKAIRQQEITFETEKT